MEDACKYSDGESDSEVKSPPPPRTKNSDDDDDDDDEKLDAPEMRVYTVGELLRNTTQSYHDRGWKTERDEEEDSFSSSGSVPRPRKKKQKNSDNAKTTSEKKRQCRRVWNPEGEYTLVRSGPPLLYEDPDDCIADLTEKSLTIFKHVDPSVVFGEDPNRPLWKGVFRMAVGGYGKDEYYEPKRTHFKSIYSADFPKKNRPENNLQVRRDGVTELPYWVDEWYHAKQAELGHKQKSKKKLQEKSRIAQAEKMGATDKATVLSPVPHVVFHVPDWLEKTVAKKGKQGSYPYSISLVADAAKKTINLVPSLIARLGKVGTVPVELPDPVTAPRQQPAIVSGATAAAAAAAAATSAMETVIAKPKKRQPAVSKKRVEKPEPEPDDDEDEEEQAEPPPAEKKVKFAVPEKALVAPTKKTVAPVAVATATAKTSTAAPNAGGQSQMIREVMKSFFDAACAGMATPGTFYYRSLAEEGMTYDQFFGPGGPGDCALPIAQMLLRRLTQQQQK